MANEYSPTWFELFLQPIEPDQSAKEVAFLRELLPLPRYRRILDLCCGTGRHSSRLSEAGYEVTGVDANARAIAEASRLCPSARFVRADMRDLSNVGGPFDAVICMWQSFGYFDGATNVYVLREVRALLDEGGRVVLDVYNRDFFARHAGSREFMKNGRSIRETTSMSGNRLTVYLDYGKAIPPDSFNWQLYQADELTNLCRGIGLSRVLACANFAPNAAPSLVSPRMQLVFEANTQ
jgi:SAM-dependent methyltransferase